MACHKRLHKFKKVKIISSIFSNYKYETKHPLQGENWKNRIVRGINLYYFHKESIQTMQINIFT